LTELIPSFLTIVLMIFTYNIGVGMTSGMITYVVLKVFTGRGTEVKAGMWVMALLSVVLFICMPKM
ncbi:MAG: NCS2 family permease, partial [Desulfuromonadaceae bacterium]|nr:NCS2 family permease [Desulfuromonadaceae bacterium]